VSDGAPVPRPLVLAPVDPETRVQTLCLVVLAVIALAAALHWLAPVLIPFVLAVFISMGLSMAARWLMTRARFPRTPAVALTAVLGIGALAGLGALVSASVAQLAASGPDYAAQVSQLTDRVVALVPSGWSDAAPDGTAMLRQIPVSAVGDLLASTTSAVLNLLSQSLLVGIFVLFLVIGGIGEQRDTGTLGEIRRSVESYLVSKVVISAATGLLVGATLGLLGVPLALAFGVLAFLLNFIPNVGSLIATLLPLPVVAVSPEVGPGTAVAAIALPAAIQGVMGNAVEPKLMGDSLDLHPVTILISLIFWGMLWGVVGMLLATPITAVVKIFLQKFEGSRPVAELMAGRLPRTDTTTD